MCYTDYIMKTYRHIISFITFAAALAVPFGVYAAVFETDLYYGIHNSPQVTQLQEFLHGQGLYDGPITGNFLSLTRASVASFQQREGIIPAQGYFGPKTRARAEALAGGGGSTSLTADLQKQIAMLQAQLAELLKIQAASPSPSPIPTSTPTPTPTPTPSPSPTPLPTPTPASPVLEVKGETIGHFPETTTNILKLGDFTIRNGTSSSVTFVQLEFDIYDGMNSTLNRNHKVYVKIREGSTTFDTLIGEKDFTFNNDPPPVGGYNRRQLLVPFNFTLNSGEQKTYSLWMEQLEYVTSGELRIEPYKIYTYSLTPQGTFRFVLTK